MRASGTVEDTTGYGLHDHLCVAYDDQVEFRAQARRFLSDGLALGQRVRYVASGDLATLRDEVSGLDGARPGAVDVESLLSTYRTDAVVQPHDQVRAYAEATTDALASGFTGLRVAAEVTRLVRSPEQRDAFARYEHLIDRYMTSEPFSAMCAYDRSELGSAAVAEIACMHPNATEGAAPFRLHAATDAAAALGGEVDLLGLDLFVRAAGRVDLVPDGGEVVLDASELTFIDHRGLLALADLARRLGVTVVLRTSLPTAHRLVDLLDIQGVRVERPA